MKIDLFEVAAAFVLGAAAFLLFVMGVLCLAVALNVIYGAASCGGSAF